MIALGPALLRDLLRAVIPAMGTDPAVPKFMQIRIHLEDGFLTLTATDGVRIHHARANGQSMDVGSALVPGASVDTLLRACTEAAKRGRSRRDSDLSKVILHDGELLTRHEQVRLGFSDTPFPDFTRLLRDMEVHPTSEITHATQHLLDAAEAATHIAPSFTFSFGQSGPSQVTRLTALGEDHGVKRELICLIAASKR